MRATRGMKCSKPGGRLLSPVPRSDVGVFRIGRERYSNLPSVHCRLPCPILCTPICRTVMVGKTDSHPQIALVSIDSAARREPVGPLAIHEHVLAVRVELGLDLGRERLGRVVDDHPELFRRQEDPRADYTWSQPGFPRSASTRNDIPYVPPPPISSGRPRGRSVPSGSMRVKVSRMNSSIVRKSLAGLQSSTHLS